MNTCPHCGAPETLAAEFGCGSQRRGNEVVRFWRCYEIEIRQKDARIAALTAAGQDAVDYCNGKHAMLNEVLDGWRKATE